MGFLTWFHYRTGEVHFTSSFWRAIRFRKTRRERQCYICTGKIKVGDKYSNTTYSPICSKCSLIHYANIIKSFYRTIQDINAERIKCEASNLKQVEVEKEVYV
jgi:hypothetical protein